MHSTQKEKPVMNAISRFTRLGAIGAGIAAGAVTVLAPGASAATTGPTPHETATNRHCVADEDMSSMICFPTEEQADAFSDADAITSARVVRVILYDKTGYSGASYRIRGNGKCSASTADVDGSVWYLGNWSDRAESFVTRNNCDMKAWSAPLYLGRSFSRYFDHDIDLKEGDWRNEITSLKVS
ncbi:hypothetical protein OHR68_27745 [Spirillospora sp. NBC_00431]